MGKHISDCFEVELHLESKGRSVLNVQAAFNLTDDGPTHLTLELISEITNSNKLLIFTRHELAALRFEIAEAIERKYWSGEYQGSTDDTNITHSA